MMLEFAESGHPIFRATSPLYRGTLKSKGHRKLSIHFTADYPTIETFSHNCFCSVFTEQSQRFVKSTKPFATDRGNPLSDRNQVPHSC